MHRKQRTSHCRSVANENRQDIYVNINDKRFWSRDHTNDTRFWFRDRVVLFCKNAQNVLSTCSCQSGVGWGNIYLPPGLVSITLLAFIGDNCLNLASTCARFETTNVYVAGTLSPIEPAEHNGALRVLQTPRNAVGESVEWNIRHSAFCTKCSTCCASFLPRFRYKDNFAEIIQFVHVHDNLVSTSGSNKDVHLLQSQNCAQKWCTFRKIICVHPCYLLWGRGIRRQHARARLCNEINMQLFCWRVLHESSQKYLH